MKPIDGGISTEEILSALKKIAVLDILAVIVTYASLLVVFDVVGIGTIIAAPKVVIVLVSIWLLICCLASITLTIGVMSGIMLYARSKISTKPRP